MNVLKVISPSTGSLCETFSLDEHPYGALPNLFGNHLDLPINYDSFAGDKSEELVLDIGDICEPVVFEQVIDLFMETPSTQRIIIPPPSPSSSAVTSSSSINAATSRSSPALSISSSTTFNPSMPSAIGKRAKSPSDGLERTQGESREAIKRERNRQAAERCRARKVILITKLQEECEKLRAEKLLLLQQNQQLLEALSRQDSVAALNASLRLQ